MSNPKICPSIVSAALQLCVSPETLDAVLKNKDRIAELEAQVKVLEHLVAYHKEMDFSFRSKIQNLLNNHR